MAQFTTTCDIAPHLITGLCKGEEDLSVLGPVTIASLCKGKEDLSVLGPVRISIKGVEKISQKLKMV